ncbi:hypothetical protein PENSPDRAFT_313018 [Peniophora sp. CONT]|nr:hypothetical protein PENSPDRAFT_313018 [Peniophora sp. CONT]
MQGASPRQHIAIIEAILPPELICTIFKECATSHEDLYYLRWTKLLLVCRRWHDIGVSTPKLWSFVECRFAAERAPHRIPNQDQLLRMVRRIDAQLLQAGTWPLTIMLDFPEHSICNDTHPKFAGLGQLDTMFGASRSLQSLTLRGNCDDVQWVMKNVTRNSHTQLQQLSVSVYPSKTLQSAVACPMPDHMPLLRTLQFMNHRPSLAFISDLRVLTLIMDENPLSSIIIIDDELLAVLARCPLLEALHLSDTGRTCQTLPTLSSGSLTFSHLTSLEITSASASSMAQALGFIDATHPSARVTLRIKSPLPPDAASMEALTIIQSWLIRHCVHPDAPIIHLLSIVFHSEGDASVITRTDAGYRNSVTPSGNLVHTVDTRSGPAFAAFRCSRLKEHDYLTAFLEALPLQAVTHIDTRPNDILWEYQPLESECWRAIFAPGMLPSLTTLILPVSCHESQNNEHISDVVSELRACLDVGQRCPVGRIVLDLTMGQDWVTDDGCHYCDTLSGRNCVSWKISRLFLSYLGDLCVEAKCQGTPLSVVELINDDTWNMLLDNYRTKIHSNLTVGLILNSELYREPPKSHGLTLRQSRKLKRVPYR